MEYEFTNDPITGSAKANFSLEHEVMGPWIEIELGHSTEKLTQLLSAIDKVDKGQQQEMVIVGHEYSIEISKEDITVKSNASMTDEEEDELDERVSELDNFEQFNEASCGLEDFRTLLTSWARFTYK